MKSCILKIILPVLLFSTLSVSLNAQTKFHLSSKLAKISFSNTKIWAANSLRANALLMNRKEKRCLQTGQWIGTATGLGLGLLHTYWSIKYTPDKNIPIWKHLVAGIPATAISSYIGSKTMRWATLRIMTGKPKPAMAALKGAFYGAIAGTVILASNYIPFFLSSYYLGTIHFNNLGKRNQALKLVGISILGSAAYGGTFGALVGVVYGPCISIYLHF